MEITPQLRQEIQQARAGGLAPLEIARRFHLSLLKLGRLIADGPTPKWPEVNPAVPPRDEVTRNRRPRLRAGRDTQRKDSAHPISESRVSDPS